MRFERGTRRERRIDIAPLVDVVFLLLLFFMLTSRMISDPAILVDLPESETAQAVDPAETAISIDREGLVFVGDAAVPLELLADTLCARFAGAAKPAVRIRADEGAAVGVLIRVVDAVRLAGCESFTMETRRP
ncbi:MAG: ExbD/TolR family protein [Desulfovibrionaceae bacterium]